jgi:hypothetical protein
MNSIRFKSCPCCNSLDFTMWWENQALNRASDWKDFFMEEGSLSEIFNPVVPAGIALLTQFFTILINGIPSKILMYIEA